MHGWTEVGEGVFARRYDPWDVTVGVVIGTAGVLMIDTRASHEEGDEVLADVRLLDRRRPGWVVNTHWHFDHVMGNARFLPVEVWGHPSLIGAVEVPPDHPVDGWATIDLGDRLVEVRHLGRGHTDGDVVVGVSDARALFAGDLVEESGPPQYGDDSFPISWPVTNGRLLELVDADTRVVPGHGAVVDGRFVAEQLAQLEATAAEITARWTSGAPATTDAERRGYRELNERRGTGG